MTLSGECGRNVKTFLIELILRSHPVVPHCGSGASSRRWPLEHCHEASRNHVAMLPRHRTAVCRRCPFRMRGIPRQWALATWRAFVRRFSGQTMTYPVSSRRSASRMRWCTRRPSSLGPRPSCQNSSMPTTVLDGALDVTAVVDLVGGQRAKAAGIALVILRRWHFDDLPSGGLMNARGRVTGKLRDQTIALLRGTKTKSEGAYAVLGTPPR